MGVIKMIKKIKYISNIVLSCSICKCNYHILYMKQDFNSGLFFCERCYPFYLLTFEIDESGKRTGKIFPIENYSIDVSLNTFSEVGKKVDNNFTNYDKWLVLDKNNDVE